VLTSPVSNEKAQRQRGLPFHHPHIFHSSPSREVQKPAEGEGDERRKGVAEGAHY